MGGRESPPHLTAGESVAVALSKATDIVKRPRSGTLDSDMSFTDVAPEGTIDRCARCQNVVQNYLHSDGLCDNCHVYTREQRAKFEKQKPRKGK